MVEWGGQTYVRGRSDVSGRSDMRGQSDVRGQSVREWSDEGIIGHEDWIKQWQHFYVNLPHSQTLDNCKKYQYQYQSSSLKSGWNFCEIRGGGFIFLDRSHNMCEVFCHFFWWLPFYFGVSGGTIDWVLDNVHCISLWQFYYWLNLKMLTQHFSRKQDY